MSDMGQSEIAAIESVFSEATVFLCDFHREQAWDRWLNNSKNNVKRLKKEILTDLRMIANSKTAEDMDTSISELKSKPVYIENNRFKQWMDKCWLPNKKDEDVLSANRTEDMENEQISVDEDVLSANQKSDEDIGCGTKEDREAEHFSVDEDVISANQKSDEDIEGCGKKEDMGAEHISVEKKYQLRQNRRKLKRSSFIYPGVQKKSKKLYCKCQKPYDGTFMIFCELCKEWFHLECLGLEKKDIPNQETQFFCSSCSESTIPDVLKTKSVDGDDISSDSEESVISSDDSITFNEEEDLFEDLYKIMSCDSTNCSEDSHVRHHEFCAIH